MPYNLKTITRKVKELWGTKWWTKVVGVALVFLLWPFILSYILTRLILNRIKSGWRLVLATPIMLFLIIFGVVWVTALFTTPWPSGPTVTLGDFEQDKTVTSSEFVVSGKIDPPGSELKINDNLVEVGEDGSFTYTISLSEGANEITFSAENEGLSTRLVRKITRELTKEEIASRAAEEARRRAEEEAAIKKSALKGVFYSDLVKKNGQYVGKAVYFRGQVTQTSDAGPDRYILRVLITRKELGFGLVSYEDDIYVDYEGGERLLEDEIIDLWGRVTGLKEYTAVLGNSRTIPWLTALYVKSVD